MAFDMIDPIGEQRGDLRAGIIAATVANSVRGKDTEPFRPLDFMPFAESGERESGPVLLPNPVEHGKLIAETLFGNVPLQRIT